MFLANISLITKFWDLVEAIEKAEPGGIIELPADLSHATVQLAYQVAELQRRSKPRYDLQAEGIYSVEIV